MKFVGECLTDLQTCVVLCKTKLMTLLQKVEKGP